MKTHRHHNIAKSRGGPDEEWNVSFPSPYDHAYGHALDFVLFPEAPWFDCRHEAWSLLPTDLKEAVRKEMSRRTAEKNRKLAEEGNHPVTSPNGLRAQRERVIRMVENGTHPFLGGEASRSRSRENRQRVESGTHNWQGEDAARRASEFQLGRVANGTHPWTTPDHSETISQRFSGAKHWVNEKGERRFQREKPEGNWQNGRKWKPQ